MQLFTKMKFKIDNLQYCKWSRKIFEINREAGLDAVHATIVYHEDFDELLTETKKWEKLVNDNSDLIFLDQLQYCRLSILNFILIINHKSYQYVFK